MMISVIVPFLNEEEHIGECIRSLLCQDFDKSEYELIFVDNGSTDGSADIVRRFPDICLLREEKRNVYAARNKGLERARGEVIAFTDADCTVAGDWLSRIHKEMGPGGAGMVVGPILFSRAKSPYLKAFQDYENAKKQYVMQPENVIYCYGQTSNMAVKAEVFRAIGTFADVSVGDTEIAHRYLARMPGAKIIYSQEIKIAHLEIVTVRDWLKKLYYYGRHNLAIEKMHRYRALNTTSRLKIFLNCVTVHNYSLIRILQSFLSLVIGVLAYNAGRLAGRMRRL